MFSDNGKSISVSLRKEDGPVTLSESCAPIPVGVDVAWANGSDGAREQAIPFRAAPNPGEEKNLLEISVAFKP